MAGAPGGPRRGRRGAAGRPRAAGRPDRGPDPGRRRPEALEGRLEELGRPLDAAVSLAVGEDELRRRLAGRATEQDRAEDDDEDAIRRRLELFDRETEPLLDFYGHRELLVRVEAEGDPDEVAERIATALEGRPGRAGAA